MRVGVAFAALAVALAGCGEGVVVRVVEGRPQAGRFISAGAYALFTRGAEAEARGEFNRAIEAFAMAVGEDPESPEIWTRIGALRCAVGGAAPAIEAAFARAEEIDPGYGPVHRERARCILRGGAGGYPTAVREAERALALDPEDLPTVIVYARAVGDVRALVEAVVRRPESREAWEALGELAGQKADGLLASAARERLAALPAPAPVYNDQEVTRSPPAEAVIVDASLVAGDVAEARRRARKARHSAGELAVRAALLGLAPFAREEAAMALGADPGDTAARIALAAVADLHGDAGAVDAAMRGIPRRSTPPSPLARLLFAEVLLRRTGVEAARAWLGDSRWPAKGYDPLLVTTERRVREALRVDGPARAQAEAR